MLDSRVLPPDTCNAERRASSPTPGMTAGPHVPSGPDAGNHDKRLHKDLRSKAGPVFYAVDLYVFLHQPRRNEQ